MDFESLNYHRRNYDIVKNGIKGRKVKLYDSHALVGIYMRAYPSGDGELAHPVRATAL